ncbi:MAG: hypothetical protein IJS44_03525 [Clostridia bacterium]|nr:hypothetical protein [Clostridia bacterium]
MATFTNRATLSYNGVATTSNMTTGELIENLIVSKTAINTVYTADDTVTYVISLQNAGDAPRAALTVTDDLGTYAFGTGVLVPLSYVDGTARYYINGTLQSGVDVTAGPPLVFTNISVPVGGSALLIYQARINEYAPLAAGASITNTVSAAGGDVFATAEETVTVSAAADLSMCKALSPTSVSPGDTVTYTFTLQNSGNAAVTAADTTGLTDTFDPPLSGLVVTFNGTLWTQGTQYTYDEGSGLFTVASGYLTVPAATFAQDETTGVVTVEPGVSTLVVTGNIGVDNTIEKH